MVHLTTGIATYNYMILRNNYAIGSETIYQKCNIILIYIYIYIYI